MVVGAGPAGLQAAIAAARNGHEVTVYEKESQAGGQVRLAASVPNRAELGDLVRNQLAECRRLGVTIEYGVGVWPGLVAERRPDTSWSRPAPSPPVRGGRRRRPTHVVDVRDVLDGSLAGGGPADGDTVVVVDELGFHQATSVAELLADRGCQVEVVTNGMVVGQDLGHHPRHGGMVDAGDGEGHRAVDRPRADGDRRPHAAPAPPPHRRDAGA